MSTGDIEEARTDRAILAAIDVLDSVDPAGPEPQEVRPWLELLGLLPQALEQQSPPASIKQVLMRRVREVAAGPDVRSIDEQPDSTRTARPLHWVFKLAAVLAVALLGVSAKQAMDLAEKGRQIEVQAGRIAELDRMLTELEASPGAPEWMAASGTELCELRPQLPEAQQTKGWLFVREDHQHWYIALEGLQAPSEGHVYELWFRSHGEMVSGGVFEPGPDGRVSLSSPTMPTGITGIAITLEPDDGDSTLSGTTVLWGDEVMLTL